MKILCFILSLSVLFLSTVPCCADDNFVDEVKTGYIDNHLEDHKGSDQNTCSPFLTCGTCSGFGFLTSRIDFNEPSLLKEDIVGVYKSQIIDDFFTKIWQPPKIS